MNAAHGLCQPISPRSNRKGRAKALLLSALLSLKFTSRLLNREHLAGVCTGKLTTSHNPSLLLQPGRLERHSLCIPNQGSWGWADLWMQTSLAAHKWCRLGWKPYEQAELKREGRLSVGLIWSAAFHSACWSLCSGCVLLPDLHVEPQLGSSLSTQELMTRLCFLLGEATPGTASSPMEDRREKKVGQLID